MSICEILLIGLYIFYKISEQNNFWTCHIVKPRNYIKKVESETIMWQYNNFLSFKATLKDYSKKKKKEKNEQLIHHKVLKFCSWTNSMFFYNVHRN